MGILRKFKRAAKKMASPFATKLQEGQCPRCRSTARRERTTYNKSVGKMHVEHVCMQCSEVVEVEWRKAALGDFKPGTAIVDNGGSKAPPAVKPKHATASKGYHLEKLEWGGTMPTMPTMPKWDPNPAPTQPDKGAFVRYMEEALKKAGEDMHKWSNPNPDAKHFHTSAKKVTWAVQFDPWGAPEEREAWNPMVLPWVNPDVPAQFEVQREFDRMEVSVVAVVFSRSGSRTRLRWVPGKEVWQHPETGIQYFEPKTRPASEPEPVPEVEVAPDHSELQAEIAARFDAWLDADTGRRPRMKREVARILTGKPTETTQGV